MNNVIIFGGTTEGRQLAQTLAKASIPCVYSVATNYGKMVMEPSPYIDVRTGRLDYEQMQKLIDDARPQAIVDATHPYAEQVKVEIDKLINSNSEIPFFRLIRQNDSTEYSDCHFFDSAVECAQALTNTDGNIFLTTGTKELSDFCSYEDIRHRLIARVIPSDESLKICYDLGLKGEQIIAMQGPFTMEMNMAFMRDCHAKYLVMKESGKSGGQSERILAAKAVGAKCFIIRRPKEMVFGKSYSQVREEILDLFNVPFENHIEDLDDDDYTFGDKEINITLVGYGMGSGSMTVEAVESIKEADYIFGAARMLVGIDGNGKKYPYYQAADILPKLEEIKSESTNPIIRVVILFSGDTGFYSGTEKLLEALKSKEYTIRVLPGISSVSALCARINESWQDAKIISTHGVDDEKWIPDFVSGVITNQKLIAITTGAKDLRIMGELLTQLEESGRGNYTVAAGFNLYSDEKIRVLTARQCGTVDEDGLCTVFIKNRVIIKRRLTPGIFDEAFIRDKVPMSKEEIRALSICKLGVTENSIVYDIGSGTGSVAVELGLLSPTVSVYAIELKQDACSLIEKNIAKFNLKNIRVVEGVAPDALAGLPVPTHVFIGGSAGRMEDMICALKSHLMPISVVVNAVTIETLTEVSQLLKKYEIHDSEILQVSVSKAKKAGDYSVMQGQNPVYIISFKL